MRDPLLTPIKINHLEIKNRIYMPAMHLGMAEDYQVTDQLVAFYKERAAGGAGMICVGYATVDDRSGSTLNIGAHRDAYLPGLKRLATTIKENGAGSCCQLNHAGRYNFSFFIDGKQPVAPSAIASNLTREMPKTLEINEIKEIVASFAAAAGRVKAAGFDAVEILSGTGYLISEFLSPLTNKREDEYGGSLNNRMRFGLEVMAAIRAEVGPDYPIIVRMNGNDFMPQGQGRKELQAYAKALVDQAGVDALCINVGWHEARIPQITAQVPRGTFAYLARGIKEVVNVPVISSHRINDSETAREAISDGMCDMVAMGRSLIADPMLPMKVKEGRENQIIHCIACAQGCFDNLFKLKHVECLCNPRAGHELTHTVDRTGTAKKVMVIGGGAAGMNAAITACDRGHAVALYDGLDRLGGQLYLAAAPPGREEFAALARDLAVQVEIRDIDVHLNTTVDKALIEAIAPDHIILATGALPMTPPIPGIELSHVIDAWDLLLKKAHAGQRVVVIGGGAVGVETALFLAEKGTLSPEALKFLLINKAEPAEDLAEMCIRGTKKITILEMLDKVGKDFGKSTKWTMLQDLGRFGIESRTGARALEITATCVRIETAQGIETIEADTVVVAAGARSKAELAPVIKETGIPFAIIGDARQIGMAFDAVHQGFEAATAI
ncbi:predicted NADH:flavin oxidoreductase/NADH oxidase [Desulforapulum autotrophicum HRM2]|uniref:Predicted NADH:flavin oxidoreductase/NADH oxidase n=1 Tax=Desulforapulum autotrophicum (strain ATCC 43914 / DSM 3382 / VKM B-1955 / HRM2) TaxID=177437 RepID=C0QFC3_DESAH|nr:FAD-dependent oxidoreductase [Desulforapulum autotrophicum]ACN13319.1 predicted NADH:flavin oxidoreductase/NADH oxidase [Desulforapulum autotrophicum HRM2]